MQSEKRECKFAWCTLPLYDRRSVLHKSRFEITAIENFDFDDTAVQPSLGFQTSFIYQNVPCEV